MPKKKTDEQKIAELRQQIENLDVQIKNKKRKQTELRQKIRELEERIMQRKTQRIAQKITSVEGAENLTDEQIEAALKMALENEQAQEKEDQEQTQESQNE